MSFNNKVYDILKWIAQIALPALATLYYALAGIWNLPYREQVMATITAIDTFLGIILGISSYTYKGDGALLCKDGGDDVIVSIDSDDEDVLKNAKMLNLRVETLDAAEFAIEANDIE